MEEDVDVRRGGFFEAAAADVDDDSSSLTRRCRCCCPGLPIMGNVNGLHIRPSVAAVLDDDVDDAAPP